MPMVTVGLMKTSQPLFCCANIGASAWSAPDCLASMLCLVPVFATPCAIYPERQAAQPRPREYKRIS